MPIRFACERCGQRLSVSSRKAGVQAKCPKCKQIITVPSKSAPEEKAEAPAVPDQGARQAGERQTQDDPYAQFVVYEEDVEWVYETDENESATRRSGPIDRDKVTVPRSILYIQGILLMAVALISFVFGLLVGGSVTSTKVANQGPKACTVSGKVEYQVGRRGNRPDAGSVVIALPQDHRPGLNERAPVDGLRPDDPTPNDDNAGLRAIRFMGGAYARADENGNYRLQLPNTGQYFVLFLSHKADRQPGDEIDKSDLAQLGRYLIPVMDLLGQRKYQWSGVTIHRDRTINVVF